MKSLIFKVSAVFVAVVSVALMGASLSVYFVHPDATSEINTPAMLNYSFEQTTGENPTWTVKRRFSVDPAAPAECLRKWAIAVDFVFDSVFAKQSDTVKQVARFRR